MATINNGGNVLLLLDLTTAAKRDSTTFAGYWVIGTPNHPDLLPSQVGWQLYKMDTTSTDVAFAQGGDGKATDAFVFTYDERGSLTYGAAGL